jgi:hypothetical protein
MTAAKSIPASGYVESTTHADPTLFRKRMAERKRAVHLAAIPAPQQAPEPARLVLVYGRNQRTVIGGNDQ